MLIYLQYKIIRPAIDIVRCRWRFRYTSLRPIELQVYIW